MQTDRTPNSTPTSTNDATDDDEFSGLHDLKALANSARARSRRATSQGDSEIASLASTSASFKAVALPTTKTDLGLQVVTPNAVALAPKGSVPSKPPLRAQGTKVDQVFGEAPPTSDAAVAFEAITRPAAPAVTSAAFEAATPMAFGAAVAATGSTASPRTAPAANNKKVWFAVGGIAAAAAVAGVLWAAGSGGNHPAAATTSAKAVAQPSAVAIAAPSEPEVVVAPTPVVQAPEQLIDVGGSAPKDKASKLAVKSSTTEPATTAPATVAVPAVAVKASTGDKSIDDLLSDASSRTGIVDRDAEQEQRKIERTELSRSDIKKAFGAVAPAASGCYKKHKEAGTVAVRVTVMPNGKVTKVTASGAFAGTPTGDCVVAATQGASFPEWDGSQTTLSYSFLLGE